MNKYSKKKIIDEAVIEIINRYEIGEQADLQKKLLENQISVSQATLSRIIKKLGIVKQSGKYILLESQKSALFKLISIKSNDSGLLILKTLPGQAQAIAAFLDQKYANQTNYNQLSTIFLGTIAGDDTIVVILSSCKESEKATEIITNDFS